MKQIIRGLFAAVTLVGVLYCDAAAVRADDAEPSAESVFGGQWSFEFREETPPGGLFAQTSGFDTTQNHLFAVVKGPFQVDRNGAFSWIEGNSAWHHDSFYAWKNGTKASLSWDHEGVLKATGQVVDTKTRTLKVTVDRWPGSGRFMDRYGGGTITVSADGHTQTYFPVGRPTSPPIPNPHPPFVWVLKPASIERQDLGPDQQREIVTYKGRRGTKGPAAWHILGDGNWTTQHIEVRQVRELKLVPRGD